MGGMNTQKSSVYIDSNDDSTTNTIAVIISRSAGCNIEQVR